MAFPMRWKPVHDLVLARLEEGKTCSEIAKELKRPRQWVSRVTNHPAFINNRQIIAGLRQAEIAKAATRDIVATKESRKLLNLASIDATKEIIRLAKEGKSEKLKYEACKDILDRVGLKPVEVHETRDRVYTPEELESMKLIAGEVEQIAMRLTNKGSAFILSRRTTMSSVTDKGSDVQSQEVTPPPVSVSDAQITGNDTPS